MLHRYRLAVPPLAVLLAVLTGCAGTSSRAIDNPSAEYTISRQRPNVMLTGRPIRNLIAGANLNPGELQGVLDANPGLREALIRNGFDIRQITGLRISPTKIVDVYTKG